MSLADQRLVNIELIELQSHYPRHVGRNARTASEGSATTDYGVIVRCESGASGWGLLAYNVASLDGFLARRLPDLFDPAGVIDEAVIAQFSSLRRELADGLTSRAQALGGRRVEELFDPDLGVIDSEALPLDFALHDLAGQILATPVYELLGGAGEHSTLCYDGGLYFDDLDPTDTPRGVDAVIRNCGADYALGYRAFKLKIGRGYHWMDQEAGLVRDIEVTRAVHAAFPDCQILVDANNGYSCPSFLDYLDSVADCGLFWIEEPFLEDEEDLRALRTRLGQLGVSTLIAEGEGDEGNEQKLLELARNRLVDVALFDVVTYGLTAWRQLMPQLQTLSIRASPHTWGSPLKTLYAGQIAAGLGNVIAVEGVLGHTEGVDTGAYILSDGRLSVPNRPGFAIGLSSELHEADR